MRRKIAVLCALSLISFVFTFEQSAKSAEFKKQNKNAVNFALYTPDYSKRLILFKEIKKLKGKGKIIINFTSYTCKPCRKEIPELERLAGKYKNVVLWIIYTDSDIEEIKKSAKFIGIKSTVLVDALSTTAGKYGVRHTPTTFVIGKDRKIEAEIVGYSKATVAKLEKYLRGR